MTDRKRIALVFASELGQKIAPDAVNFMEKWCCEEGYDIVAMALSEKHDAAIGQKTADMMEVLIAKDMIDGVVTYSAEMFASKEGEATLINIYSNGKFFISYVEEMQSRTEEEEENTEEMLTVMML